jgi:hypothetical protein
MRSSVFRAAIAVCSLLLPVSVRSQGALRDQPVPRELVEALLASPMGRAPSIVVGQLPPSMAGKLFIPPGARVLGGMYSNAFARTVFVSPERPESIAVAFRRELPKLGWTYFERPTAFSGNGGFRDAPSTVALGTPAEPIMYCAPGRGLMIQIESRTLTESLVSVMDTGNNMCAMMQDQSRGPRMYDRPRTPTLINPPGARSGYGSCESNNFSSSGSGGPEITTSMTPEEILNHYGRQLADSGWKQTPSVGLTRSWTKTDSTGVEHEYEITVKTFGPGSSCRRISTELYLRR